MKCSQCKQNVIQKSQSGGLRLRLKGAIEVPPDGPLTAQCYWCGTKVELPIELQKSHVSLKHVLSKTKG